MRRVEPAYSDLFPISHVVRPGYLPGPGVSLDPIRMGIVWEDAPRRVLPKISSLPRDPARVIVFARVAMQRQEIVRELLERGSSLLLVLDDPSISEEDLGLDTMAEDACITVLLPVLPTPLRSEMTIPEGWRRRWGAVLGLFPFPGAREELEERITKLSEAGAGFAISAPLLLTPKDRHRILAASEGDPIEDRIENCLFHADVSRGLHMLERCAGVSQHAIDMDPILSCMVPKGHDPNASRTAALLRLWARRLDQSYEEGSWGWRLRRAASALDRLDRDPAALAREDNLRVVPGFDPWVESFTRSLWDGGEPVDSAWQRWSGLAALHQS